MLKLECPNWCGTWLRYLRRGQNNCGYALVQGVDLAQEKHFLGLGERGLRGRLFPEEASGDIFLTVARSQALLKKQCTATWRPYEVLIVAKTWWVLRKVWLCLSSPFGKLAPVEFASLHSHFFISDDMRSGTEVLPGHMTLSG